jgi:hypothetical protein
MTGSHVLAFGSGYVGSAVIRAAALAVDHARRVLRSGAPFVATFSNRCFPTKAVAIMRAAGFTSVAGEVSTPEKAIRCGL